MSKRSLQRRPTELPTPPRGRSARSLYNTSSAQPATLSLNVQSFQSTTFNGGRRIYGYHPLTSRTPFVSSARPFSLPSSFLLSFFVVLRLDRPKLVLRKVPESENWLCAETKTILWERNGLEKFHLSARYDT